MIPNFINLCLLVQYSPKQAAWLLRTCKLARNGWY